MFFGDFLGTFQLEALDLRYSDIPEAPETVREDCCPGAPYISFHPTLALTLVNPCPQSGLFAHHIPVRDQDTVAQILARLARVEKKIKGKLKRRSRVRFPAKEIRPCIRPSVFRKFEEGRFVEA